MDMFMDEISELVKETFENVYGKESSPKEEIPKSAGVVYHLEQKGSIFVIRAIESRDLSIDIPKFIDSPDMLKKLRLTEAINPMDELAYFECDDIFIAKTIVNNLANKRFPLYEEHVMNISDPGDSWWLKIDQDKMSLYFKLCRTESLDNMIKLGPIGDNEVNHDIFNKLYGYFNLIFEVKDFSSQSGSFHITPEDANDTLYREFVNVFKEGEVGFQLMNHLRDLENKSDRESFKSSVRRANYFLLEISHMRGFWVEIQKELASNSN